ncbi:PLDc N-terminal domain-containing protein [Desertivirga xinjiangensis]|uniref:PLDc N-terminal domain-containing protein n=1 Tax=Desertivirga xinjiangensis TaxID=539206 RepID=UPI002109FFB9|nr:PLDc N-terminal domain-containing protein [Pedobacter xinjiangensis]
MNKLLFLNIGFPEVVLILFFGAIPLILIIVSLASIMKSDFKDSTTRLIWVLIVLFLPVLGSLLYLLMGRRAKQDV